MSETCFCTMCGQKLPANINFCPYCGTRLAGYHSTDVNSTQNVATKNTVSQTETTKTQVTQTITPQAITPQAITLQTEAAQTTAPLIGTFYVFAVQGPAFGMVSGDIVLEKAQKLHNDYESAKNMPMKLIRPGMWNARAQGSSSSGVISVSYSINSFKNEIKDYLKRENIPDVIIDKGIAISDESSLQLTNPMSGVFVIGIPIIQETQQSGKQQASTAVDKVSVTADNDKETVIASDAPTANSKPKECSHEYKHFVCAKCGEKAPKPYLKALGKNKYDQYTYEYYRASESEEAKYFLEQTEVTLPLYYVMVETPEGKWGRDKDGIFLEGLLDFQSNLSLAQCQAETATFPLRMEDLQMAANKITDNYLLSVTCGSCGYQWKDGVAYRSKTIVKCPECGKYNLTNTENIRFNNL